MDAAITLGSVVRDEGTKTEENASTKVIDMRKTKKSVEYLFSFEGTPSAHECWIPEKSMSLREFSLVQNFKKQDSERLAQELDKGLEPESIISLSKINGRSVVLLKWKENENLKKKQGSNQASYISKWIIEEKYPHLLAEFFEHGFNKTAYQYVDDVWHYF